MENTIKSIMISVTEFDRANNPAVLMALAPIKEREICEGDKEYDGRLCNYIVVVKRCIHVGTQPRFEYVRWWWNADSGLFWGHYCSTLDAALRDFGDTVVRENE